MVHRSFHEGIGTWCGCSMWDGARQGALVARLGKKRWRHASLLFIVTLSAPMLGCSHGAALNSSIINVSPANEELDRLAISVARHCGVTMARYRCSSDGYPFQLRTWWEVSFPGREPTKVGIVWVERDKHVMPKVQDYEGFLYVWTDPLNEHLRLGSAKLIIPIVASYSIEYQAPETTVLRLTVECDGKTRARHVEIPGIVVPTPSSSGGHLAVREGEVQCLQSFSLLRSGDDSAIQSGAPKRDNESEKIAVALKLAVELPGAGWPPPQGHGGRR